MPIPQDTLHLADELQAFGQKIKSGQFGQPDCGILILCDRDTGKLYHSIHMISNAEGVLTLLNLSIEHIKKHHNINDSPIIQLPPDVRIK